MSEKIKFTVRSSLKETLIMFSLEILILSSLISFYYLNSATAQINNNIAEIKENQGPAALQMIKIVDSSCQECFNVNLIAEVIVKENTNVTESRSVEFSSEEGKQLISEYSIEKIPAIIVEGETNKTSIASLWQNLGGKNVKNNLVIESIPPYRDVSTNQIKGLVNLVMLTDNSCGECYNVTLHKEILPRFGVFVKSETMYDITSSQGKDLLNEYNITKVPTMLLSPEADVYLALKQVWSQVGTIEKDGWFVFRATEQMGNFTTLER